MVGIDQHPAFQLILHDDGRDNGKAHPPPQEDLQQVASLLKNPQGPILLDCKINAEVAAPFMGELAAFESGED